MIQLPVPVWMKEGDSNHSLAPPNILAIIEHELTTLVCGTVDRVILDDGKARGVMVDVLELTAEVVFIEGGTIDTPLLLMRSEIGRPSLGMHLTYHPVMIAPVVLDESLRPPTGAAVPPPRLQIPPTPDSRWNVMVLRDTSPDPPHPDVANVEENALVKLHVF